MQKIPKLLTVNKVSKDEEQAENRDSIVEGGEKRKKVFRVYYCVIYFIFILYVRLICWGDMSRI